MLPKFDLFQLWLRVSCSVSSFGYWNTQYLPHFLQLLLYISDISDRLSDVLFKKVWSAKDSVLISAFSKNNLHVVSNMKVRSATRKSNA